MVDFIVIINYYDNMRIRLSEKSLEKLFRLVLQNLKSWKIVATKQNVSVRTLSDWRRGKLLIPLNKFENLLSISGLDQNDLSSEMLPNFWHIKAAAKKGGLARMKLYGNFGTPEGRRLGGLASLKTHNKMKSSFKVLKLIQKPKYSEKLAEFMGILIGDGHLSEYQLSVTTNSKTDREHALFVQKMIKKLFGIQSTLKNKKRENAVNVVASSKTLVQFINNRGMPIGNKIKNSVSIPPWILRSAVYKKAFIRGLFDTDGCIYLDTHKINGKTYKHLGWTITSASDRLIADVLKTLRTLGFSPTNKISQESVYLRRQKEIKRYFKEIGTSNLKHYKRYRKFIGGVPKWS